MRRLVALSLLLLATACGTARHPAVGPAAGARERLAAADRLLQAGCYACFGEALDAYVALRGVPSIERRAAVGAVKAALLLTLRERELGMADSGRLATARAIAAEVPDLEEWLATSLEIVDVLPGSIAALTRATGGLSSDEELRRSMKLRRDADAYAAILREHAAEDDVAAYLHSALMCAAVNGQPVPPDEIFAVISRFTDLPSILFRRAICRGIDRPAVEQLLDRDPRFVENSYLVGLAAMGRRPRADLDGADAAYRRAYAWHPRWPSLTQSMANLAMTAEDFERAARLYDETLGIVPLASEARLGKVRALTYLGRHEEAIAETDRLLEARWNLGDARYWRALNELQLQRYDEAWLDVEEAAKLLINADVPKLAGLIAYRRKQLPVSRAKFEESRTRNADDCETGFYLGVVLAELREWTPTADILVSAAQCLQRAETKVLGEIDAIRASDDPPERQRRQIARREQQIAAGRRMLATSWFNAAVAYYSLERSVEARQYAERLVDDEQFGDRAREILSRLREKN